MSGEGFTSLFSAVEGVTVSFGNTQENIEKTTGFFEKLWEQVKEYLASAGINLVIGLVILIIGWRLINVIVAKFKKSKLYSRIDPTMASFMKSIVSIGLKAVLIIIVASILGVPMASMITVIGSCGLTVGLALQGSLSNIAGGFIIAVMKPFKVGDFITSGQYAGTVKSINIFYTKIITPDNSMVLIPNSEISNTAITDCNAFETRKLILDVAVDYSADTTTVKNLLMKAAQDSEYVLDEPASEAVLINYGDSALDFQLRVWCKSSDYWTAKFALLEEIKALLDKNDIGIPYPQMDIHIDNKQ